MLCVCFASGAALHLMRPCFCSMSRILVSGVRELYVRVTTCGLQVLCIQSLYCLNRFIMFSLRSSVMAQDFKQ